MQDSLDRGRQRTLDVDLLMIVATLIAASIGQAFDGALLIVIFATSGALEAFVTRRKGVTANVDGAAVAVGASLSLRAWTLGLLGPNLRAARVKRQSS